jgi:hypothetical protein
MKNASRGMLELSRGVEDFAVSFGTGGLAGGIRGAGNNLSQLAFIMGGPVLGAIGGLGVAGLAMWSGFNSGAEKAIDKVKEFEQAVAASEKRIKSNQSEFKIAGSHKINLAAARDGLNASEVKKLEVRQQERLLDKSKGQSDAASRRLQANRQALKNNRLERERIRDESPLLNEVNEANRVKKNFAILKKLAAADKELLTAQDGDKGIKASVTALNKIVKEEVAKLNELKRSLEVALVTGGKAKEAAEKSDRAKGIALNDKFQAKFKKGKENREKQNARNDLKRAGLNERAGDIRDRIADLKTKPLKADPLPSGENIFSASAQSRLTRAATGRIDTDQISKQTLKAIERLEDLLKRNLTKLNNVPVNL